VHQVYLHTVKLLKNAVAVAWAWAAQEL
jgi:hypothetical protein